MDQSHHASTEPFKEVVTVTQHSYDSELEVCGAAGPGSLSSCSKDQQLLTRRGAICGLSRTVFLLVVALIVVIVTAGVGGGVGGFLAVESAKNSLCSKKAGEADIPSDKQRLHKLCIDRYGTRHSGYIWDIIQRQPSLCYLRWARCPTAILALDCPNLNTAGEVAFELGSAGKKWRFRPTCGTDYTDNDIGGSVAYSFEHCLHSCASRNAFLEKNDCLAVYFNADLPNVLGEWGANCFMKNQMMNKVVSLGNLHAAAELVI